MALQHIHPTPWKVWNELRRYAALPVIRFAFALNGIDWGRDWRIYGMPIIQKHRGSQIILGAHLHMRSWRNSNPLGVVKPTILCTWAEGAQITLGEGVALTGTTIVAQESINIGSEVRIGANVVIIDTDFHPIDVEERLKNPREGKSRSVIIEDNCFIGMASIILKGTRIGAGSIIGAGSVVTGDIAPNSIVAGNPANLIRTF